MENADLLRKLGWSEELIRQVSCIGESLSYIDVPTSELPAVGDNLTVTTTDVIYCSDDAKTHNSTLVTV